MNQSAHLSRLFDQAMHAYQDQNWKLAQDKLHELLVLYPKHAEALHLMGVIAYQEGRVDQALKHLRQAIAIQPNSANYHSNLGLALQDAQALDEAASAFMEAIRIQPAHAEAYFNLGNIELERNNLAAAITNLRQALSIRPDYLKAQVNLADVLHRTGDSERAEELYRQVLHVAPRNNIALTNLRILLNTQKRSGEMLSELKQAVEFDPGNEEVWYNLGCAYTDLHNYESAIKSYEQALSLNPRHANSLMNCGNALLALTQYKEAEKYYRLAVEHHPEMAEAHNNLAITLNAQGRKQEAADCFEQALSINPDNFDALSNYGVLLVQMNQADRARKLLEHCYAVAPHFAAGINNLGHVLKEQGKIKEAITFFRKAIETDPNYAAAQSNLLFCIQFDPDISMAEIKAEHEKFGQLHGTPLMPYWPKHKNMPNINRRLRIGYVSPDFRGHVVSYFIEPILANHDRQQFDIYLYSNAAKHDKKTPELLAYANKWRDISRLPDNLATELIELDQIDILFDLAGHTAGGRLLTFARKPAPIQITYLGYPSTTGLVAMDYRLTDAFADPIGTSEEYYVEKLLRLPNSLWCYRPPVEAPEPGPLPALTNGYLTFGSFNAVGKIGPAVIALWAKLLKAIPDSRLLMTAIAGKSIQENIREQFAQHGVASDRLEIHDRLATEAFWKAVQQADIALDPFPVGGGTTTCETLWLGTPVLTCIGDTFLSRAGYSLLNAAGLGKFAAHSEGEFIDIARRWAADLPGLASLRESMRSKLSTSALIDEKNFTKNLEQLLKTVWHEWCVERLHSKIWTQNDSRNDILLSQNNRAMQYQAQDQPREAEQIYHDILALAPDNTDALNGLGLLAYHQQDYAAASDWFRQSLAIEPRQHETLNSLGGALQALGQADGALELFRRAVELKPDYTDALHNLAHVFQKQGRLEDAALCYTQVIEHHPDQISAYCDLSLLLQDLAHFDDAETYLRQAISLSPHTPELHNNLGNLLRAQKRHSEAVRCFEEAIRLNPEAADCYTNLGTVFSDVKAYDKAHACFSRALELKPDSADALFNRGVAYWEAGQYDESIQSYRKVIEIDPKHVRAVINLGAVFERLRQDQEAEACYRRALELDATNAMAWFNLGNMLKNRRQFNEAVGCYRKALELDPADIKSLNNLGNVLRDLCQLDAALDSYCRALETQPDLAFPHSNMLFCLNYYPEITPLQQKQHHEEFERLHASRFRPHWPHHANTLDASRRLRIGYVSPDFRSHAVATFFEPILTNHDRQQFEIYLYSNVQRPDAITQRLFSQADHAADITQLSEDEAASLILRDGIDILMDLAGHTGDNRLMVFARKPAPIQITYLGYPSTTGLAAMDYRITDHIADPTGNSEQFYTEKLLRMPDSAWCYQPPLLETEITALPALENGHITFGSFNNFTKVGPKVVELWAELLKAIPEARLLLVTVPAGEVSEKTLQRFVELGIEAGRVRCQPNLATAEFWEAIRSVDIALDPFPLGGGTTTCETLWMGVPVVTLVGNTFISRAGYSLLLAANMKEFTAYSQEEYIDIAKKWAHELPSLAEVRTNLRDHLRQSPLLDAGKFTRHLEQHYRQIWKEWVESRTAA